MSVELKDRIRKLREDKKLTQANIAGLLKISRLTYISIENGDKKPNIDQLEAIAAALGVTIQELLFPSGANFSADLSKYRQMCQACIHHGAAVDGKITKTKLAKLLYLVDFSWFVETGRSMSGLSYRALPRGPVADQFFQMTDEMVESGQVAIEPKGMALMFSNIEQPTNTKLSTAEAAHIRKIAEKWQPADTQTIVDFTHEQSPWMLTAPGSEIPYELARQIPATRLY